MSLANELLDGWAPVLHGVALRTGTTGRFEVSLDGELIFSKSTAGRHAEPGEIRKEVERRIGAPLDWRK